MSSMMTTSFPFPTSYDVDDAIYDVPLPELNHVDITAFELLQKSDPFNIKFTLFPRFKFLFDTYCPQLGYIMEHSAFQYDVDFQLNALKVCFYDLEYKFDVAHPDPMSHVKELVEEVESAQPGIFLDRLMKFFQDDYLLTRSWYCRSSLRQLKTLILAMVGIGKKFEVRASCFDYEINCLLREVARHYTEYPYNPQIYVDAINEVYGEQEFQPEDFDVDEEMYTGMRDALDYYERIGKYAKADGDAYYS